MILGFGNELTVRSTSVQFSCIFFLMFSLSKCVLSLTYLHERDTKEELIFYSWHESVKPWVENMQGVVVHLSLKHIHSLLLMPCHLSLVVLPGAVPYYKHVSKYYIT